MLFLSCSFFLICLAIELSLVSFLIQAIYVVLRMGVFYSSFTWKHLLGLILTSLAYVIPYQQLAAMAKPAYTDDGELLDGGFDMSTGGICGCVNCFSNWNLRICFLGLTVIWILPTLYLTMNSSIDHLYVFVSEILEKLELFCWKLCMCHL